MLGLETASQSAFTILIFVVLYYLPV